MLEWQRSAMLGHVYLGLSLKTIYSKPHFRAEVRNYLAKDERFKDMNTLEVSINDEVLMQMVDIIAEEKIEKILGNF